MKLGVIGAIVGIAAFFVHGLAVDIEYERVHKPMAKMMYAEMLYDKCMRRCLDVCEKTCDMMSATDEQCECEPLCKQECAQYITEGE